MTSPGMEQGAGLFSLGNSLLTIRSGLRTPMAEMPTPAFAVP